jgi:hypothetical protein
MQFAVVIEQREIGEGAPGIKCELGHCFLEATILQSALERARSDPPRDRSSTLGNAACAGQHKCGLPP